MARRKFGLRWYCECLKTRLLARRERGLDDVLTQLPQHEQSHTWARNTSPPRRTSRHWSLDLSSLITFSAAIGPSLHEASNATRHCSPCSIELSAIVTTQLVIWPVDIPSRYPFDVSVRLLTWSHGKIPRPALHTLSLAPSSHINTNKQTYKGFTEFIDNLGAAVEDRMNTDPCHESETVLAVTRRHHRTGTPCSGERVLD